MAINDVRLYGQIMEDPRFYLRRDEKIPHKYVLSVKTLSRFHNSSDKSRIVYDEVILMTENPDMIQFARRNLQINDMIYVKGILCTADTIRKLICGECGSEFTELGYTCYVHPIHIVLIASQVSDDQGYTLLRENAEVSNEVILDGRVCTEVSYYENRRISKEFENAETEIELQAARQRISAMNVRIRQLEEQYHSKEQTLQSEITRLLHVEDSARRLCTLILSKDRNEMRLGEDYTWNSVNSEELIRRTSDSYTAYCKKRVEHLQTLKDFAMSKSDCLERAEETISRLKEANEQLMTHGATPQAQKIIRDMIQEDDIALKEAYSRGKLIIEDCGEGRKALARQAVALRTDTLSREETDAGYKKQMRSSGKQADPESAAERKAIDTILDETRVLTNILSENEGNIVRKLGEGMSVAAEIRKTLDIPGKAFSEAHKTLALKSLVVTETQVRFPGTTNPNIIWLTLTGKQAYKLLTGEYPQIAECEKLKKYHATMEHGYGIRACFRILKQSGRYKKLEMFASPINLYNGSKYQPDIFGLVSLDNGEDEIEYFEYERVRQAPEDYAAKFNKMALIMDEINVIVGNVTEHGKMQEYMYNWAQRHKDIAECAGKVLRLTSFTTLQARIEGNMPFEQWWHISARLDSFPAAGE